MRQSNIKKEIIFYQSDPTLLFCDTRSFQDIFNQRWNLINDEIFSTIEGQRISIEILRLIQRV